MARPRKEINEKDFESLLAMQCTLEEVTAFFDHKLNGCSEDTIERWCKRTYKQSFAEISSKKRDLGKISLRRAGFELAKKNPSVHIFYAKNYLGMTDHVEVVDNSPIERLDAILGNMKKVAEASNGITVNSETE